jgi:hypothetical protein
MVLETNHRSVVEYVRMRGYVSYSTLKMLRDGGQPGVYKSSPAMDIGTELHARWLEKEKPSIGLFDPPTEKIIKGMHLSLNKDKIATALIKKASVEVEFTKLVYGVNTRGYIDILPPKDLIGDLKTTVLTSRPAFIKSMDFLQAALYLKAMTRKDFYYVGVSKIIPHEVFTFRVSDYPDRMKEANAQLKELLTEIKNKL